MKLPNFIIAGCGKAGTTSLYAYLEQHPDIFLSTPKEPRYFAHPEVRPNYQGPLDEHRYNDKTVYKWDDYHQLFSFADKYTAVGEASPVYMTSKTIPHEIEKRLGKIKIIIILRNPIDIAYSAYNHQLREGGETLSFSDALSAENERASKNWAWHWRYSSIGNVVPEVLSEYLEVFGKENVKIVFYDDYSKNNECVVRDLFQWLGVDASVTFQKNRANDGGVYSNTKFRACFALLMKSKIRGAIGPLIPRRFKVIIDKHVSKRDFPKFPPEIRRELSVKFTNSIHQISEITETDLGHWLEDSY